jgi:hypothetical protein
MMTLSKTRNTVLICLLLFFLIPFKLIAQPVIKADWQASWITYTQTQTKKNSWTIYRKTFELSDNPGKNILASIATDSKYWMYINDTLVVFEGQLKRGPTPVDTYYDEVDIAKYLRKGKNTIAVLVWFWGQEGFCHKNSGRTGLLFEAPLPNSTLVSDASWKVKEHTAFGATGAPFPNYRLPEYNIHFDAQKDIPAFYKQNFDDKTWENATFIAKAGAAPWNKLWKRPIPLWKDSGIIPYQNAGSWPAESNGEIVKMKLPKNLAVTPYLKIDAPAGLLIDIRTDNYKGGSEYNVRTEYVTKAGVQEFETLGYMNGHEVYYNIPKGVKIIDLKYRETAYNSEYTGYFKSDNEALNSLWVKSLNTMSINMRDAIQDPDRERAQWWGDVVIILGEIFYSTDNNGIKAIQKSMSNLVEWQKDNKVLFSPIPAGKWDKELPAQMLASVGKYGFYKYFEYTNDSTFIQYVYPHVRDYMSLWQINEKGLVVHREGGWDWHDWGDKIDVPLLDNAWYYMALDGAALMAEVSGFNNEAKEYRKKMQIIKAAFNKNFWNGSYYKSADFKFTADDRGNGLAVVAGLADKQQWQKMRPMLDTTFNSGPYLEKYVLEAYYLMNEAEKGTQRMLNRYKAMIESPVTTLWEGWQVGSGTYGGGSYNHGWSGGPLTLMSQYITGLSPDGAGYQNIRIFPQPAGLKNAEMGTYTVAGYMKTSFEKDEKYFKLYSELPKEKNVKLGIPKFKYPYKKIVLNGKIIWKQGEAIKNKQVVFETEDANYIIFNAPSGRLNLHAKF